MMPSRLNASLKFKCHHYEFDRISLAATGVALPPLTVFPIADYECSWILALMQGASPPPLTAMLL
jgi:hypothetical protein